MSSDVFAVRDGVLHAEDIAVPTLAAEVGTPFYVYSAKRLRDNYKSFAAPFAGLNATVYYANKANPNLAVTATLAQCGAGADITSIGELERALRAGVPPHKIIFSGVCKRGEEIEAALHARIHQLNVESMPELRMIDQVAREMNTKAPVTLRINPDVDARTHKKISTGETGTKFGIDFVQLEEVMALLKTLPNVEFKGFQMHIGSHVSDYEPYREAYTKMAEMVRTWRMRGYTVERLDLGGGVGIPYDGQTLSPFSEYADIVKSCIGDLGCEIAFEPGRRLVGDAGMLITRVVYDKQGAKRRFLIVDAGMNDLVRPAMYDARHSIQPVLTSKAGADINLADVVGPVCETSDLFGLDYTLPGVGQGDLVAIMQAGAYGAAMSGNYNGRPLIPEVLVDGGQFTVVRRRIAVAEQMAWESLPPGLEKAA